MAEDAHVKQQNPQRRHCTQPIDAGQSCAGLRRGIHGNLLTGWRVLNARTRPRRRSHHPPHSKRGKWSVNRYASALGARLAMALAGTPATTAMAGMSPVATAPAATTAPRPIFVPGMIVARVPIQT